MSKTSENRPVQKTMSGFPYRWNAVLKTPDKKKPRRLGGRRGFKPIAYRGCFGLLYNLRQKRAWRQYTKAIKDCKVIECDYKLLKFTHVTFGITPRNTPFYSPGAGSICRPAPLALCSARRLKRRSVPIPRLSLKGVIGAGPATTGNDAEPVYCGNDRTPKPSPDSQKDDRKRQQGRMVKLAFQVGRAFCTLLLTPQTQRMYYKHKIKGEVSCIH